MKKVKVVETEDEEDDDEEAIEKIHVDKTRVRGEFGMCQKK